MAHQSNQFYKLLLLHNGIVPQTLQPAKLDTPYLTPVLSHPDSRGSFFRLVKPRAAPQP